MKSEMMREDFKEFEGNDTIHSTKEFPAKI